MIWKLNTPWAVGAALFVLGFAIGLAVHPHQDDREVIVIRYPQTLAQWYVMGEEQRRATDEWMR